MDPIATVALLCNVLDLTERAYKCLKKAKETYESTVGLPEEHRQLLDCTNELAAILDEVRSSQADLNGLRNEEVHIQDVANKCKDIASDIIVLLEECRSKAPRSVIGTIKGVAKSIRHEKRLWAHQANLEKGRQTLHLALTLSARSQINNVQKTLDQERVENDKLRKELGAFQLKLGTLNDVSDQLQQTLNLCHEAQKARKLHAILQVLSDDNGRNSNPRYDDVFEASTGTFDWVLLEPKKLFNLERHIELTFVDWLRDGKGIFHVLGKPGSGKSTLMKLIWDHNITKEMLKEWAGDSKLLCMKYFFWKPEPGQSGLRGFKSSLMSSMLEQAPGLVDTLAPEPVGDCISYKQLSQAFDLLLKSPQTLYEYKVFLLIDGLDEFDEERNTEDHHDLVRLIQTWPSHSEGRVKICVSSREYEAFIAMERHQKIRLQDLTRKDIKTYVTERLKSHPRFPQLKEYCQRVTPRLHNKDYGWLHSCKLGCLVKHIVNVSDGVFLWVRLVMVQVRKCLSADCNIHNIWRHVDSQPRPLTEFIKHMFDSILPLYQREAYILLSFMHRIESTSNDICVSLQGASYLSDRLDRVGATLPSHQSDYENSSLAFYKIDWRTLAAEEITARFNGLVQGSIYPFPFEITFLTFTHRSIVEVLQECLEAKITEHGISQIELGNWMCQITLSEFISIFNPLEDHSNRQVGFKYLKSRLGELLRFLKDHDLFEDPSILQQLGHVEDICLTVQYGNSKPSEGDWQKFTEPPEDNLQMLGSWINRENSPRGYFSFLVFAISKEYVEALPWIVKRLEDIPRRGQLASILLSTCIGKKRDSIFEDPPSSIGCKKEDAFLTAFLNIGLIGNDLPYKAHVSKHGHYLTESWFDYVRFLFTSIRPSSRDWAITELWLREGVNPRIRFECKLGCHYHASHLCPTMYVDTESRRRDPGRFPNDHESYISIYINGRFKGLFRSGLTLVDSERPDRKRFRRAPSHMEDREYEDSGESFGVSLRGLIARSDAPNKKRLLELVDGNSGMIEAEETVNKTEVLLAHELEVHRYAHGFM